MAKAKCWVLLEAGRLLGVAVRRRFWNGVKLDGYTVAEATVTWKAPAKPKRRARKGESA